MRSVPLALLLTACSGGVSSGHPDMMPLTPTDLQAIELAQGWIDCTDSIQRWDLEIGGAYPSGLTVLGRDTAEQDVAWIAGVIVHEDQHHCDGRPCSTEGEARAIRAQIEFDQAHGGRYADDLRRQIGEHTCGG